MSEHKQRKSIVVGVDGSAASKRALEWALEYAEDAFGTVTAVHAWERPALLATGAAALPPTMFAKEAQDRLDEAVDEVLAARPGSRVDRRIVEGHPAQVMVGAAEDADLLVLGSRGHGGFVGSVLGSVSHHAVHRSPCPVLVVRDRK